MLRMLLIVLLFNLVIFVSPNQSLANISELPTYYSEMSDEWKFSRAMVQAVRNEYRMALHITERFLACFTGDKKWFAENKIDLRDSMKLCEARKKQIRDKSKQKLPLMRIFLALSMQSKPYHFSVTNTKLDSNLYQFPTEAPIEYILGEMLPDSNNIAYPQIRHTFPTVDLAPLNAEEMARAIDILNNDLAWVHHKYGAPKPQSPATCFSENKNFPRSRIIPEHRQGQLSIVQALNFTGDGIGPDERSCYYDLYISHMFGGQVAGKPWTEDIEGFPLLAYFSGDIASDEAIIEALKTRIELTRNSKKQFEDKYYHIRVDKPKIQTPGGLADTRIETLVPNFDLTYSFISELVIYESLIDEILKGSPDLKIAAAEAKHIRSNKEIRTAVITIAAVFGAIPVCASAFTNPISRGLCMMPFGLGLNGYMVYESEQRLRNAVNDMLMSPNGLRVLNHIDTLSDYQFNKNLEWLMMPIGTGILDLKKGFKEFMKNRKLVD